ncbi:MAG: PEP-CTERM sorting domain-containing protein [Planctomycetota bacterium]
MGKFTLSAVLIPASLVATGVGAVPIFDDFGPFPQATFGGSGIPNDAVAFSEQIANDDTMVTIALAASQRFTNPPLGNDGAGTYFATPGSNAPNGTLGALWNFNSYVEIDGGGETIEDFEVSLLYDMDPAFNTPVADLGVIDISGFIALTDPGQTLTQGSQNLLFDFLNIGAPFVTPPPSAPFDPNALGEYTFAITVSQDGLPVETVAINVVVVPEPAAALMLAGLGVFALRRTRSA